MHRAEHIAARPLFLGPLLVLDDLRETRLERAKLLGEARQRRIMDDAEPRARRQVEIRRIDDPLHVAARPGHARERFELGQIAEHARARTIQRHRVGRQMGMQVQLCVHVALGRQEAIQLVQQSALELAGLDLVFGPRGPIDDADRYARMANAVAQLGGEVPLDLVAAEVLDARQDAPDQDLRPRFGEQRRAVRDAIARVALLQVHLKGASIRARRGQQKLFAQRPEAQQADAEFALQAARALHLQLALDGIADVRRHVVEIRLAVGIPAHALAVVLHAQVMLPLLLAPGDDDRFRARIDAVFDQLGHRLERIALRQGDDGDRIPVIADAQIAAGTLPAGFRDARCHAALFPDPRVEAARATTFEIIRIAGDDGEIVLQARRGDQTIDDGQRLAACFRRADQRAPTGRNA